MLKMKDIEAEFTKEVEQYISQGFRIDTSAMNGHQGEVGKVALTDGEITYMIYLHNETEYGDREHFAESRQVMKLTVEIGEYTNRAMSTFWLGAEEHQILWEKKWYELDSRDYNNKVYTESWEELKEVRKIRKQRSEARGYSWTHWEQVNYNPEVIIRIIKAKTGRKRVHNENIVRVERHLESNLWHIETVFNGKHKTISVS